MRAIFNNDPAAGAGYGTIDIYGAANALEPCLVISRTSDGKTLSSGGWRDGRNDIAPLRSETLDGFLRVWLGPDVVNEISRADHYEIEMPGFGKCALHVGSLRQSVIVEDNGAGLGPLPPEDIAEIPEERDMDSMIYEGVEKNPEVSPIEPYENVDGVIAAPESIARQDKQPKGKGCLTLCLALAAIWIAGGILLWHGAINSSPNKDESFSIEIIPKAQDTSIPGDNMEETRDKSGGS